MCVGCVGACWGVCDGVCGGVRVGVYGREWSQQAVGERRYRSPLYYPDTLVNPEGLSSLD